MFLGMAKRTKNGKSKNGANLGFYKSAILDQIKENGYILTSGRYVRAETVEDDGEAFEDLEELGYGK
jgi:type I restriction-modification system DNA methylase subunit